MSDLALQLARRTEPRHVLMALAALVASLAALDFIHDHALDSLIAFRLDNSDPERRVSLSALVVCILLLGASALAFAASRFHPGGAGWWRVAGWTLVFVGVEQMVGLHHWIERHGDLSWNAVYLPVLVFATVAWVEAGRLMSDDRLAQLTFGAGVAAWLVAGLLDAARASDVEALAAGEVLEMAAAGLMMLGLLQHVRERSLAERPADPDARRSTIVLARGAVGRLEPGTLAIWVVVLVAVLGVLGSVEYPGGGSPRAPYPGGGDLRAFDLNKEQTYPATFSALLLLAAGGFALLNGLVRTTGRSERRWWIVLALVFTFLGIDESMALHEILQDRVHLWGQAVLAPVALIGSAAWWVTLRRLRPQPIAARLFALGGASWALSQAIDYALNEHWGWTIVPEELLEMSGSALFALALLVALRPLVGDHYPSSNSNLESRTPWRQGVRATASKEIRTVLR